MPALKISILIPKFRIDTSGLVTEKNDFRVSTAYDKADQFPQAKTIIGNSKLLLTLLSSFFFFFLKKKHNPAISHDALARGPPWKLLSTLTSK